MKISRKIMMASAAVLLGVGPVATIGSMSQDVSAATSYTTNSKTSSVVTTKNVHFVDKNGKTLPLVAEKGGTYAVYSIQNSGSKTYYKVDSSSDYWLPSSATKGRVTYTKNGATYTISTNENTEAGTVKPHATSTSTSTSSTITLKKNAYLYNSKGKRQGKVYLAKGTVLTSKGTKRIKKKLYYNIGNGHYIKAGNVKNSTVKPHATTTTTSTSSSSTTTKKIGRPDNWQPGDNTLKLKKNAIPYDKNGKKRTDLGYTYIKKNTVLNYYGTTKINGKTYYDLGDGVYIKAANVGSVTNK